MILHDIKRQAELQKEYRKNNIESTLNTNACIANVAISFFIQSIIHKENPEYIKQQLSRFPFSICQVQRVIEALKKYTKRPEVYYEYIRIEE